MPLLKADKQMKLSQHDCLACKTLSATKCMDNKSVILLYNYHDPRIVKDIEKSLKTRILKSFYLYLLYTFCSSKMIEDFLFAVSPAMSHCVSRKKEAVFIYTALSNKQ